MCIKNTHCFLNLHFHSVEKLTEVARHHIESSSKIEYEITLENTDFFINSDVKVVPDPDPVPSPHVPHTETYGSDTLTISQLTTLHKQFLQMAPNGKKKFSFSLLKDCSLPSYKVTAESY